MTNELHMNQDAPATHGLGKRMNEVACALFLIMSGALWLAPEVWAPEGAWLIGVGLILLGLNLARRLYQLRINAFGIVVGLSALVAGIVQVMGVQFRFVPLLLVVLGTVMIINAGFRTDKRKE
jgi:hypothetical protein